jgi:aryl-alcohol dehydrogenase-like predicted oxidoreductase
MQAVDDSLRRLGMDYIDLYQIHRWDYQTPIEETLETLNDIVRAGKARYIGASSMWARQFQRALEIQRREGWARFVSMQNYVNLCYREEEREMLPLCREEGVGVIPWSPLARGRLARPWGESTKRSENDAFGKNLFARTEASDRKVVVAVEKVAARRGIPMAHVSLAWLLAQPGMTAPIIGVTKMEQLDEAIGALDVTLTDKEVAALEAHYVPHPIMGHD